MYLVLHSRPRCARWSRRFQQVELESYHNVLAESDIAFNEPSRRCDCSASAISLCGGCFSSLLLRQSSGWLLQRVRDCATFSPFRSPLLLLLTLPSGVSQGRTRQPRQGVLRQGGSMLQRPACTFNFHRMTLYYCFAAMLLPRLRCDFQDVFDQEKRGPAIVYAGATLRSIVHVVPGLRNLAAAIFLLLLRFKIVFSL